MELCKESLSKEQGQDTTLDKPIVTLPFILKACKDTSLSDKIDGLPQMALNILCVAVTLNQVRNISDNMTIGTLKHYVFRSMGSGCPYDEDDVTDDTFLTLIHYLFDAGLLNGGTGEPFDVSSQQNLHAAHLTPIRLGVQLYDVEAALEKTIGDQPFYRRIMENARKA